MAEDKEVVGTREKTGKRRIWRWVGIALCVLGALLAIALIVGFSRVMQADEYALDALSSDEAVEVAEVDSGWLFDGAGERDLMVLVGGAFVDERAYAPLARELAEGGVDVCITKAPLHIALLDTAAPLRAMQSIGSSYERLFVAGHSLGGVVASSCCAEPVGKVRGLVLMASYAVEDVDRSLPCLLITATNDKVLNREAYEQGKTHLLGGFEEVVIEGGNHAQFGSYGAQDKDGEATISKGEQLRQTADAILWFIKAEL